MSGSVPYVGDLYDMLGVARAATPDEIKKAFRKIALECHPDRVGDDPAAAERFDRATKAYEVLSDPEKRARYDKGATRRPPPVSRGNPQSDGYRMPGGFYTGQGWGAPPGPGGGRQADRQRWKSASNRMSLDDLMGDFGFGGGAAGGPPPEDAFPGGLGQAVGGGGGGPRPDNRRSYGGGEGGGRSPGRDITLQVDVPVDVAQRGGTVTLHYPRLRLSEDGASVARYDEIHDLRVPPGTRHGETLRVPRYGDAGTDGTSGDLVCDVRLVAPEPGRVREARQGKGLPPGFDASTWPKGVPMPDSLQSGGGPTGPRVNLRGAEGAAPPPPPAAGAAPGAEEVLRVPVSVVEALLGGRIPVDTPAGRVHVTLPPCKASDGARVRVRGKGTGGGDILVELRVVLPAALDDESRALIERFAELNPYDPRDPR